MEKYPKYSHEEESVDEEEDLSEESQSEEEEEEEEMSVDDDDELTDYEEEESVWSPIITQAKERHREDYEALVEHFVNVGMSEHQAKDKAYRQILPTLQKEARQVYLENLQWIRQLRKDPIHKQVMETKQTFMNDDEFEAEEATEAAVHKRKYLLKKIFDGVDGFTDSDNEEED